MSVFGSRAVTPESIREAIAAVHEWLRRMPSGLSLDEIVKAIDDEQPELWEALIPDLRREWVRREIRSLKDPGQLSLFAVTRITRSGVARAIALARAVWGKEQYRQKGRAHYRAIRENQKCLDALGREYYDKFHEQLELWPAKDRA